MIPTFDLQEVKDFIRNAPAEWRVYIGCDSSTFQKAGVWFATYSVAVAVHRFENGAGRGCKCFGREITERIYDKNMRKPHLRLITEAYKLGDMYQELEDVLQDRFVELHLDLNSSPEYASNAVLGQAVGYLRGLTGISPENKPDSPAGSFLSDRLSFILSKDGYFRPESLVSSSDQTANLQAVAR